MSSSRSSSEMGDDLDVDALLEEPYLNKEKVRRREGREVKGIGPFRLGAGRGGVGGSLTFHDFFMLSIRTPLTGPRASKKFFSPLPLLLHVKPTQQHRKKKQENE